MVPLAHRVGWVVPPAFFCQLYESIVSLFLLTGFTVLMTVRRSMCDCNTANEYFILTNRRSTFPSLYTREY